MVVLHDLPAVQLVPQYAVVKVSGVFHHVGGVFLPGEDGVLVDVALVGHPLTHDPVKVGDDQIALVVLRRPDQGQGGLRRDPIVAVQKLQVGAPGLGQGQVPGVGNTGVLLMKYLDSGVPGGLGVAQGAGGIGAAVVDQQQLIVLISLV